MKRLAVMLVVFVAACGSGEGGAGIVAGSPDADLKIGASADSICDFGASRSVERKSLRRGEILVPPAYAMNPISIDGPMNWIQYNNKQPSFLWWLNTLSYLRPLIVNGSGQDDVQLASRIAHDWIKHNSGSQPDSIRAWDGHAAALRAETFACINARAPGDELLVESLREHASFLSDDQNYQGNWNHGLDQNLGLAAIGCTLHQKDLVYKAKQRAVDMIEAVVDPQGVSIEQSIAYQYYNYVRINTAISRFAQCGSPLPPDVAGRVERMPDFLMHAVAPDGLYEQIGDTELVPPRPSEGISLNLRPDLSKDLPSKVAVYDGGYIFGRTGWGSARPFSSESFYSLRFGPGRIIHGHNDHTSLTYYYRGNRLLIEGGFHGYTDDKWRAHLRSPAAHNVVYATDDDKFRWQARTDLSESSVNEGWQSYRLVDEPYAGTFRVRNVLVTQIPFEAVVVVDTVKSQFSRSYAQAWHFSRTANLTVDKDGAMATMEDSQMRIFQLWPFDSMESVKGRQDPIEGWAGYTQYDLAPTPTLITRRSGRSATFLTVLVPGQIGARVGAKQSPAQSGARRVVLSSGDQSIVVDVAPDGRLTLRQTVH